LGALCIGWLSTELDGWLASFERFERLWQKYSNAIMMPRKRIPRPRPRPRRRPRELPPCPGSELPPPLPPSPGLEEEVGGDEMCELDTVGEMGPSLNTREPLTASSGRTAVI